MTQLPSEQAPTVGYAMAAPSQMRPGGTPMRGLYPIGGRVARMVYSGQLETDEQRLASERAERAFKRQRLDGRERLAPQASLFDLARTRAGRLWVNPLSYGGVAVLLNSRCERDPDAALDYEGGPWQMDPTGPSMRCATQRVLVGGGRAHPAPRGRAMAGRHRDDMVVRRHDHCQVGGHPVPVRGPVLQRLAGQVPGAHAQAHALELARLRSRGVRRQRGGHTGSCV